MKYSYLVDLYEKIASTTKRLEKTCMISEFLKELKGDYERFFLLLRGRVFPEWDSRKTGFAANMAVKALSSATGLPEKEIINLWKEIGDLGDVAEKATQKKKQSTLFSSSLNIEKVFLNIRKLSTLEGQGSASHKISLVSELLSSASPKEARYIIRTVLEDMRLGIGDSALRDSIAWSCFDIIEINSEEKDEKKKYEVKDREKYNQVINELQDAYDLANDWARVFAKAKQGIGALKDISLELGRPVKVMLYPKAIDIDDAMERLGTPCAFEYKYDGFRMQIHKSKSTIKIFTRRLEDVTDQFPEIKERIQNNVASEECILDCEAVGFDSSSGKYMPFQYISQRIKRKYSIHELSKKFPVELNIFDVLYADGKNMIKFPYSERRKKIILMIKEEPKSIIPAHQFVTSSKQEAEDFFNKSVELGNEGLMAKKLDGIYKPGARMGYGFKIKSLRESLDLVIVGAEYGEGKRAGWLSSFIVACVDEDGSLLEIGKVSTGFKEKKDECKKEGDMTFSHMTELLKPLIIDESKKSVKVKPQIVIEVAHEELQKSHSYMSGYALRFPRFIRMREDKSIDEVSSIDYIDKLFREQT